MFQHILVPLDGSSRAERVLPVAARVACASGGAITLVHVVEGFQATISYGAMNPVLTPGAIERSLSSAKTSLEQVRLRNDLAGVLLDTQVVMGHPAMRILSILDEQAIDLVIISSHGLTGVRRWLLGSIAEKVVHASPVLVLLLRGEEPLRTHVCLAGTRGVRALVPLDGSTRALEAIDPVAALVVAFSSPGQGEIHLLQIVKIPEDVSEGQKEALLYDARQYLQDQSEQARKRLAATFGPNLSPMFRWSVPLEHDRAAGIIRRAEHGEKSLEAGDATRSDLLALTTYGWAVFSSGRWAARPNECSTHALFRCCWCARRIWSRSNARRKSVKGGRAVSHLGGLMREGKGWCAFPGTCRFLV